MRRFKCSVHGRYVTGCSDCRRAAREYSKLRADQVRAGTWERMLTGDEVEAARQALLALLAHPGITVPRVATTIGTVHSSLYRLKNGSMVTMFAYLGTALMELTPDRVRAAVEPRLVDNIGTTRRLQALAADGWTTRRLSELSGIPERSLSIWRLGRRRGISPVNRTRVAELYDKIRALADPRGDSPASAALAQRQGWPDPDRWDDDEIDDPQAQPLPPPPDTDDHVETTRLVEDVLRDPAQGRGAGLPLGVKREVARHAAGRLGWSQPQIAWLLGYKSPGQVGYLLNGRADRREQQ